MTQVRHIVWLQLFGLGCWLATNRRLPEWRFWFARRAIRISMRFYDEPRDW